MNFFVTDFEFVDDPISESRKLIFGSNPKMKSSEKIDEGSMNGRLRYSQRDHQNAEHEQKEHGRMRFSQREQQNKNSDERQHVEIVVE